MILLERDNNVVLSPLHPLWRQLVGHILSASDKATTVDEYEYGEQLVCFTFAVLAPAMAVLSRVCAWCPDAQCQTIFTHGAGVVETFQAEFQYIVNVYAGSVWI